MNSICILWRLLTIVLPTLLGSASSSQEFILSGYFRNATTALSLFSSTTRARYLTDVIYDSVQVLENGTLTTDISSLLSILSDESSASYNTWIHVTGKLGSVAQDSLAKRQFLHQLSSIWYNQKSQNRIHGFDLDFHADESLKLSPAPANQLIGLLQSLRTELPTTKLSVRLAPTQGRFASALQSFVDRIHIVTYDYDGDNTVGYSASFQSFQQTLHEFVDTYRVEPKKLIVGIPTFGRHIQLDFDQYPLSLKPIQQIEHEIRQHVNRTDFNLYGSSNQQRFQAYHGGHGFWKWYGFESPYLLQQKVDLVKEFQLGGLYFSNLEYATNSGMLEFVSKTIRPPPSSAPASVQKARAGNHNGAQTIEAADEL